MNGEREPNYIGLDTRVLQIVRRLSDDERLAFFDGLQSVYVDIMSGNYSADFPDSMVGELLRQAAETVETVYDTYMKRVRANPSGKKANAAPEATQRVPNATQSNQDQIIIDKNNLIQVKQELLAEGFSAEEIDEAVKRSKGKELRDPTAYIRQAIRNNGRQQKRRPLPAQDFPQRDYSPVPDEEIKNLAAEIKEAKKAGLIE